jgi:hypothetical protein
MSLLPFEQQQAVFEAMRQCPALSEGNYVQIPDILNPATLDTAGFSQWVRALQTQSDAGYRQLDDYSMPHTVYIPEGIIGFRQDGTDEYLELPGSNEPAGTLTLDQLDGSVIAMSTHHYDRQPNLHLMPGVMPGFDTKMVRVDEYSLYGEDGETEHYVDTSYFDINTTVVAGAEEVWDLCELGLIGFHGATPAQMKMVAQARTLSGGAGEQGLDLLHAIPHLAYARHVAMQTLGRGDFVMPALFTYRDTPIEFRPLQEHTQAKAPEAKVDLGALNGDLEYSQEDYRQRLELYGAAIVTGKPFVLREDRAHLAPSGSIVLVDDEFGLNRVQPAQLSGASAIVTRGYTGESGIRAGGHYDHLSIIGRSLVEENPGDFVYFKVPHINPETEERAAWDALKSCDTVTVATDGTNIKIRGNPRQNID